VLMAANTQIRFESVQLSLRGGDGGNSYCGCFEGGAGAGGELKLVAAQLISPSAIVYLNGGNSPFLGAGAGGILRVEGDATQFNLNINGQSSGTVAATPGPVFAPSTPTLRITQIGSVTAPAAPTGNTATPDVSFPTPPSGPVTVTLAASNIPTGTTIKVRVTPQVGGFTEVTTDPLTGTLASSTTTASVTIPPGYGAIAATTLLAGAATSLT
jgi:hypothetical protein